MKLDGLRKWWGLKLWLVFWLKWLFVVVRGVSRLNSGVDYKLDCRLYSLGQSHTYHFFA